MLTVVLQIMYRLQVLPLVHLIQNVLLKIVFECLFFWVFSILRIFFEDDKIHRWLNLYEERDFS